MNVYEMEGFLRGKCLPGDLLVGESNAAYLVRKLNESATLKAERDAQQKRADALAVENDRARKAVQIFSDATQELTEIIGDEIGMDGVAKLLAGFDAVGNMPATDAALAAIEARGVDQLIERKLMKLANMHPYTHAFGATATSLRAQINELQAFAAELREAK